MSILDDPVQLLEVEHAIWQMHSNKAAGPTQRFWNGYHSNGLCYSAYYSVQFFIEAFIIDNAIISKTRDYVYLGPPWLTFPLQRKWACMSRWKINTYLSTRPFIARNYDVPYCVKDKVRQCALNAAIFCGCETWLCRNVKFAESAYHTTLKLMLGVRET